MKRYDLTKLYIELCRSGDYNRATYVYKVLKELNKQITKELQEYRATVMDIYKGRVSNGRQSS